MAMIRNPRKNALVAASLVAPFVLVFALVFAYPTFEVIRLSFTDSPLIGGGQWIGLDNFRQLLTDRLFYTSLWNGQMGATIVIV